MEQTNDRMYSCWSLSAGCGYDDVGCGYEVGIAEAAAGVGGGGKNDGGGEATGAMGGGSAVVVIERASIGDGGALNDGNDGVCVSGGTYGATGANCAIECCVVNGGGGDVDVVVYGCWYDIGVYGGVSGGV